jgi:hypothetical protein
LIPSVAGLVPEQHDMNRHSIIALLSFNINSPFLGFSCLPYKSYNK